MSPTLRVGIVVLRWISVVITPPRVSTPNDSGGDVEEQDVFDFATQDAALNGRADGNDFVWVHAPCEASLPPKRSLTICTTRGGGYEELADEHDFVNLIGGDARSQ